MPTSKPRKEDREMNLLTPREKAFLDVFLHEATTSPFTGPATEALHKIGIEYHDISYLAWAYDQEVPKTDFGWGHAAEAPPLPWATREAALSRNEEMQHFWQEKRQPVHPSNAS
jgi:hypothetical protein